MVFQPIVCYLCSEDFSSQLFLTELWGLGHLLPVSAMAVVVGSLRARRLCYLMAPLQRKERTSLGSPGVLGAGSKQPTLHSGACGLSFLLGSERLRGRLLNKCIRQSSRSLKSGSSALLAPGRVAKVQVVTWE